MGEEEDKDEETHARADAGLKAVRPRVSPRLAGDAVRAREEVDALARDLAREELGGRALDEGGVLGPARELAGWGEGEGVAVADAGGDAAKDVRGVIRGLRGCAEERGRGREERTRSLR